MRVHGGWRTGGTAALIAVAGWTGTAGPAELDAPLAALVTADSPAGRTNARRAILRVRDLTCAQLDAAFSRLDVWPPDVHASEPLSIRLGEKRAQTFRVFVRLPGDYTPRKAWPLLMALHGTRQTAESMLQQARQILDARGNEFIIAAPQDLDGPDFVRSPDEERRPRQLLAALRKKFHIDDDRVFLTGYSLGAHRAMLSAALHGDCFAGVMPLAGSLVLPGNDLLYPTLLENYRNVPVLLVWGEEDMENGITPRNRALQAAARAFELPKLTLVELANRGHLGVVPPPSDLADWLKRRREHYPRQVYHAFRLAETSQAYWVRAERLKGAPLAMDREIRAPKQAGESNEQAMQRYLRSNLGVIRARVDGQTIEIEMQRVARLELLLHDDLVDLDQPIKIRRNGADVFDGVVPRDPGVMLTEAVREWDFGRLPRAKVVVPASGRVKPPRPSTR